MSNPIQTTSTTQGARDHARAQEGTVVDAQPVLPAASFSNPPVGIEPARLRWVERVAGGNSAQKAFAAGTVLQLTDVIGDACASLVVYNALQPVERLNIADTVKVQWQAYTRAGQLLLSDQGRVLASVLRDDSGHHDAIFGTSSRARNEARYGDGAAHGGSPAGRELFTVAAAKHGLGRRDIPQCISFFKGVRIRPDGAPEFLGSAGAGASVTLKFEMPAIVLIANAAHPLDPSETYRSGPLDAVAWADEPTGRDEPLWNATPEGRRAYLNTRDYLDARGIA